MNIKEIQTIISKALDKDGGGISDHEFDSYFTGAINETRYHDAVLICFLMYFQAKSKSDPKTRDALELLKDIAKITLEEIDDTGKINKSIKKNHTEKPVERKGPYCTFCDASAEEVEMLIEGPSVYICNKCVGDCMRVLQKKGIHIKA